VSKHSPTAKVKEFAAAQPRKNDGDNSVELSGRKSPCPKQEECEQVSQHDMDCRTPKHGAARD
jgi:hypothetical protein